MKKKTLLILAVIIVLYVVLKRSGVISALKDTISGKIDSEEEANRTEEELIKIAEKYTDTNSYSGSPVSNFADMGINTEDGTIELVEKVSYCRDGSKATLGIRYPYRPCLRKDNHGACIVRGELEFIPKGEVVTVIETIEDVTGRVIYLKVCYNGYSIPVDARYLNDLSEHSFDGNKVITSVIDAPDVISNSVEMVNTLHVIDTKVPKNSHEYHRAKKLIGKLIDYSERLSNKPELSDVDRKRIATYVAVKRANDIAILKSSALGGASEEVKNDSILAKINSATIAFLDNLDSGNKRVVSEVDSIGESGYRDAVEDGSLHQMIEGNVHALLQEASTQSGYEKVNTTNRADALLRYLPTSKQEEIKSMY